MPCCKARSAENPRVGLVDLLSIAFLLHLVVALLIRTKGHFCNVESMHTKYTAVAVVTKHAFGANIVLCMSDLFERSFYFRCYCAVSVLHDCRSALLPSLTPPFFYPPPLFPSSLPLPLLPPFYFSLASPNPFSSPPLRPPVPSPPLPSLPSPLLPFRFIPPSDLSTEAVFVVDDDVSVPCEHLLAAFGVSFVRLRTICHIIYCQQSNE